MLSPETSGQHPSAKLTLSAIEGKHLGLAFLSFVVPMTIGMGDYTADPCPAFNTGLASVFRYSMASPREITTPYLACMSIRLTL